MIQNGLEKMRTMIGGRGRHPNMIMAVQVNQNCPELTYDSNLPRRQSWWNHRRCLIKC